MKILLLVSQTNATGNLQSALRIQSHLESGNHQVIRQDTNTIATPEDMQSIIDENQIDLVFGVQGIRSGPYIPNSTVPSILLIPGPELELVDQKAKWPIVCSAIEHATLVTTYHQAFMHKVQEMFPGHANKISWVTKSTTVDPSNFSLRQELDLPDDAILLLHLCGIRPIKDCDYLVDALDAWKEQDPRIHCIMMGNLLNKKYGEQIFERLERSPAVAYHAPLERSDLHAAIQEANVVLNTALAEGVPNALLETMALGTPIVARNILGNSCFLEHKKTGFLYDTPEEFLDIAQALIADVNLQNEIVQNAKLQIETQHKFEEEREGYLKLIENVS